MSYWDWLPPEIQEHVWSFCAWPKIHAQIRKVVPEDNEVYERYYLHKKKKSNYLYGYIKDSYGYNQGGGIWFVCENDLGDVKFYATVYQCVMCGRCKTCYCNFGDGFYCNNCKIKLKSS